MNAAPAGLFPERGCSCDGSRDAMPHTHAATRRWRALLLAVVIALLAFAGASHAQAIEPLPFQDQAQEARFQHLTRQLRCLVCQNENLADSNAELARDLRREVFKLMQQGQTDAQIKQYLVARYSNFVLYDPPLLPGTWLLWFGPGLILLAGAGVVLVAVRKRRRDEAGMEVPNDNGDDW
jgi:cytochrome c-type biogenesis protein CcmH